MKMAIVKTIADKIAWTGKYVAAKTRKSAPEIGLVVGGLCILTGTVLACTKTSEAVDVNEKRKREIEEVKANTEEGSSEAIVGYSKVYLRFAYRLIRIYGIPAVLWIGGMSSIVGGHIDLKRQNANLILDSVAFKKIFDEYRSRVAEKIGEEEEKLLYFGAKEDEIEIIETNPETGATKIVRKHANVLSDGGGGSIFARNFSAQTSYEFDVRSYADYFLEARIINLNKRLKNVPFLTINDVYDELGMKKGYGRCREGRNWGWYWDPNDPNAPSEIVVERLKGWEKVYDEKENKTYYVPCLRIDFNCQPLK